MEKELRLAGGSFHTVVKDTIAKELRDSLYQNFIPAFCFVQEKRSESFWLTDSQMISIMPLYGYTMEQKKQKLEEDSFLSLDEIRLAESQEGMSHKEGIEMEEVILETEEEEDAAGMEEASATDVLLTLEEALQDSEDQVQEEQGMTLQELLQAENEAAIQANEAIMAENEQTEFVPHTLQTQVDRAALKSYETLIQDFYTIDANTMAGSDQLDAGKLLGRDMRVDKESPGPQILIYHTHSQEAFVDSVAGDTSTTIIGVGEYLSNILTKQYGYQVLHHTGQYDVESRDDAYSKALPAIEQVLKENPSIQVVIDLHRDSMPEETKLVMDLDGRPTARFMFFNGLSRTRKTGDISYLYNENLTDNLAFSFQMQLKAMEYYPGLTRKIYLKGYRYNMHIKPKTLLVELGAQNNTLEEAMNACDPLAHILDMVLSGQ
ncbi:MAG: stage II sporulation protein P [Lachnospiraceae bacterium]|nr:stage II sporulation protein P [Lachnospiraceae bacterium]